MAESPYPGSPSLSAEAREKVLQTFRHTIHLAESGRNEEALLGCDFILKMDTRFQPARRLLDSLRGVASGTVVDLAPFSDFAQAAVEAPAPVPPPPSLAPSTGAPALDDLAFDDFAAHDPFGAAPPLARPPEPAPLPPPPPSFSAPPSESDPWAETPAAEPGAFEGQPPPFAPSGPASSPSPASPSPAVDARITQFLKQGDEAMSRGHIQEAIDLWSRVFLIDLSNDDASRRIDAAREKQEESARRIDSLLQDGIREFESGDLASARNKFLDVLALSERDSTARNYLNQIDAAMTPKAPTPDSYGASPDFMKSELEAASAPSFDSRAFESSAPSRGEGDFAGGEASEERERPSGRAGREEAEFAAAAGKKPVRVNPLVLVAAGVVLLLAIGGGSYYLLRPRPAPQPPPASGDKTPSPRPAGDDPIAKAQALFDQGRVDEALAILSAVPASDPSHTEVLQLIDRIRTSPVPTPAEGAPSAAEIDQRRLDGMAAMKVSHYIDAVKNLDAVVKARPDDAEAAQALTRAREQVAALGNAVKSYNEQDFESAIKLLWGLRKQDAKNQDVEEFLFKSYFNEGIQDLQAGNFVKASQSLQEATQLRASDTEAQRHLKFARKYSRGATDLLSKIYLRHAVPRP